MRIHADSPVCSHARIVIYAFRSLNTTSARSSCSNRRRPAWQPHFTCRKRDHSAARSVAGAAGVAASEAQPTPLQNFLGWLQANGVTGIGEADSKLGIFEGDDGSRGMLFFEDAKAGEVLIRIPLRLAITDHPDDERSNAALGPGSALDLRLAFKLLEHVKQGPSSPWHPFIQVLPREICSPFGTWPASAQSQLQMVAGAHGLQHALAFGQDGLPSHGISGPELRWALSVVNSRSFATPGPEGRLGVRMLVPLADMFNHAGDEAHLLLSGPATRGDNAEWNVVPAAAPGGGWEFQISALREVEAGEEALFCYGDMTSWQFFLHSGFVPARNSHEAVTLFGNVDEAVRWFLDRFPPQDQEKSLEALVTSATQQAETQAKPLADALRKDPVAVALHGNLQMTSRGQLDARLMAALTFLAEQESSSGSIAGAEAKAERLVGLRIAELLYHPNVTSILLDLQLLASLEGLEEDERAYFQTLLLHYRKVVERFEADFAAVKALASSVSSADVAGKGEATSREQEFDEAGILALRLRASQKQVLWNGLQALIMQAEAK